MVMKVARGYQLDGRDAVERHFASGSTKGAMVVAATGTGKTALAHLCMQSTVARGDRVLFLAHREELVTQARLACNEWFERPNAGIVMQSTNECSRQIVYASKDTIRIEKRLEEYLSYGAPSLVFIDEAHHSASVTWRKLIQKLADAGARIVGLTATPDRSDTSRLSDMYELVFNFGIMDGIAVGALVPPYVALDLIEEVQEQMSSVSTAKGDYNEGETEAVLLRNHIIEATVDSVKRWHSFTRIPLGGDTRNVCCEKIPGLIFTVTVHQAQLTAEALEKEGFVARAVWGNMPKSDRRRFLQQFRDGKIDFLVNAGLLTEGTDLPRAKVAFICRPTKSWTLYVQIVGRVLRPFGDADAAYIVDLCGATQEHSIVSAPVLVDGYDCEKSHDGRHRYLLIEGSGQGRCKDCGNIVACIGSSDGNHKFDKKTKKCKLCGEIQCPDSGGLGHIWQDWEGNKRACVYCAMQIPDPLSAMVGRVVKAKEKVMWKDLDTPYPVWTVNLGSIGMMFNVIRPEGDRPFLYTRDKLHPLSPGMVSPEMSRMLTDDVARRSQKTKGFYGGQVSDAAMKVACTRAELIAKKLRIWEM